ncbi:uncharacterized protein LOC125030379 [Penaeus chinensis]|uniref:uncharacterized protein LOC125030379 n=1 Tax=Penaeus chinensis TaxID=139456 RepID=UPI001FB5F6C3|nr:uncharacterized protein LOC125030379 [Penaeus chinensis]
MGYSWWDHESNQRLHRKRDQWDCSNHRGIALLSIHSIPGKTVAHILLRRVTDHLLRHQKPEQSGFTSGKSTTDCILVLQVNVERHREFRRGLLATYIDLKKSIDTVHCESLVDPEMNLDKDYWINSKPDNRDLCDDLGSRG